MNILITGICGFAGNVIARGLAGLMPGVRILGIDNLSRKGSETNLQPLRGEGFEVSVIDVRDRAALDDLPATDWVIDCAANPSILAGLGAASCSRDLLEQNLYGTVNLLEKCREWKAGFILLSTSRVYSIDALRSLPLHNAASRFELPATAHGAGWSEAGVKEDFSTAAPISLYGSSKLCSEALALEYGSAFGFPVWINRCGVLAGAGQFGKADQGIFSYWIHSWKSHRPLRYIGFGETGHQVRDCLHPRDLVLILAQQLQERGEGKPRIINLSGGAGNSMSLAELTTWCSRKFGPNPKLSAATATATGKAMESARPYDLPWVILDHARAAREWGWRPITPLTDILEEIALHAETHPAWLELVA